MHIDLAIIEDQTILRETLAESLSTFEEIRIVGCWSTAEEALTFLKDNHFDVALIDLFLPGIDAIGAARRFRKIDRDAKTIIMTMFLERINFCEATQSGVTGILHKNISVKELVDAIFCVHNGETVFDQKVIRNFVNNLTPSEFFPGKDYLTDEELQILRLASEGYSTNDIAEKLSCSIHQIKKHFHEILKKLNARDRTHAVAKAFLYNILNSSNVRLRTCDENTKNP